MRKTMLLWMLLATAPLAHADGIVTSDTKQLPAEARQFISRHFAAAQISYIKIEKKFWGIKKYEVLLTDRTEIEFTADGKWTEVECDGSAVPEALVPDFILRYVKSHFPHSHIVKIEQESGEIEVELENDYSLTFNKKGELIEIDD